MCKASRWICEVCGYIHEGPEPPETCPVCGVGAELFGPVEDSAGGGAAEPEAAAVGSWRCGICAQASAGDRPPHLCPVCGAAAGLFQPHDPDTARVSVGNRESIVVIGGGVAGLTAAEHARRNAPAAAVSLVHKEPDLPYNRLNLTRLLAGEVDEAALPLRDAGWYAARAIDTIEGEVVRIRRDRREIVLRDGRRLGYHRLVLANGSHPFVPPLVGVTRTNVWSLRTKRDALAVVGQARPGARCACLGGGLLGLEAAGALRRRGAEVTVLEGADRLLPRQLARPAAQRLQRHLEGLGMRFVLQARSEEIVGDEEARGVRLTGGEEVPADFVVLATGVRPNSYLARQCGLEVQRGVLVDDRMQTSDHGVFAAGDVAEHRGVVHGLWPTAMAQGAIAGAGAAGRTDLTFRGAPPATQLKVVDLPMFSVGQFEPADGSYRVHEHETSTAYYRLVSLDGRLVGANLLGDTEASGVLRAAIEDEMQLAQVRATLGHLPELLRCLDQGAQK